MTAPGKPWLSNYIEIYNSWQTHAAALLFAIYNREGQIKNFDNLCWATQWSAHKILVKLSLTTLKPSSCTACVWRQLPRNENEAHRYVRIHNGATVTTKEGNWLDQENSPTPLTTKREETSRLDRNIGIQQLRNNRSHLVKEMPQSQVSLPATDCLQAQMYECTSSYVNSRDDALAICRLPPTWERLVIQTENSLQPRLLL